MDVIGKKNRGVVLTRIIYGIIIIIFSSFFLLIGISFLRNFSISPSTIIFNIFYLLFASFFIIIGISKIYVAIKIGKFPQELITLNNSILTLTKPYKRNINGKLKISEIPIELSLSDILSVNAINRGKNKIRSGILSFIGVDPCMGILK